MPRLWVGLYLQGSDTPDYWAKLSVENSIRTHELCADAVDAGPYEFSLGTSRDLAELCHLDFIQGMQLEIATSPCE